MACVCEDKTHLKDSGKGWVTGSDGTESLPRQPQYLLSGPLPGSSERELARGPICPLKWHNRCFALKINPVTIHNRESNKPNQIYRNSSCILDKQTCSAYLRTAPDRSAEMQHIFET